MNTGNERHCVIGPGRLGRSLLAALSAAHCHVVAVVGRGNVPARTREGAGGLTGVPADELTGTGGLAGTLTGAPASGLAGAGGRANPQTSPPRLTIGEAALTADLWWLTVPDDALAEVAAALAAALPASRQASGLTAVHCSGLGSLELLAPLAKRGVRTLSMHPLTSFSRAREPQASDLAGVPCAVTAQSEASSAFGERLAFHLGMLPFGLTDERKPAYHLAATVACNLLVALQSVAGRLMNEATGATNGLELLKPLLAATATNLHTASHPAEALSGPVARGDMATVLAHLTTLTATHPEFLPAYRALSLEALALAEPQLAEDRAAQLAAALAAPVSSLAPPVSSLAPASIPAPPTSALTPPVSSLAPPTVKEETPS